MRYKLTLKVRMLVAMAAVFMAISMSLSVSAQTEITVSYWGSVDEAGTIESMIDACAAETGVSVENIWLQADYVQQILTLIAGGTPPDVIMVSSGDLRGIMDQFLPLEGVDTSAYAQEYSVQSMSVGGELRAIPWVGKPKALAINTRLFEDAGVELPSFTEPMTPEQYSEMAIAITSGEGDERIFGSSSLWFGQWMFIFGGRFFNEDGTQFTVNTPEAIGALEYVENAAITLNFAPNSAQLNGIWDMDWFLTNRVATYQDFGILFLPLVNEAEDLEWDVVPVHSPTWPYEIDGFGISRDSDSPEVAQQFALCMGQSPAAQTVLGNALSLGIPVTAEGQEAFLAADPDHNLSAFLVNMENAVLEQQTCMSSALWMEFYNAMFADVTVYGGDQSPADFLAAQEEYINSEFACN
jgi:multiple sugar transport system substrate-binding protein